ncbi:thiamine-phosphate kinase [Infirmifilum sp. SLHALR2]
MLREDVIVDWITSAFRIEKSDAVAIETSGAGSLVVNVDAFDSEIHWPPFLSAYMAGRRAYIASTSDVIVKGGKPVAVLVSLRIPSSFSINTVKSFVLGLESAASELGARYLGGDTDVARGGSFRAEVISIGVPAGKILHRKGAKPGDLLAISGCVGTSSVVFKALAGELDSQLLESALSDWMSPQWPRLKAWFEVTRFLSASIDNSDGLALTLHYLAESSGVRLVLDEIPICSKPLEVLGESGALESSLYQSGEEYNFVFAFPKEHEWVAEALGARIVGRVVEGRGVYLNGYGEVAKSGWISGEGYYRRA